MIQGKKIVVVITSHNASSVLKDTYDAIPQDIVDEVILVDNHSKDNTVTLAKALLIKHIYTNKTGAGFGACQKSAFEIARKMKADVLLIIQPENICSPLLTEAMVYPILRGVYDMMLATSIPNKFNQGKSRKSFVFKFLTLVQNILFNHKFQGYHAKYQAFNRQILENMPVHQNSDHLIFNDQLISQALYAGYHIGELNYPCREPETFYQLSFGKRIAYYTQVVQLSFKYRMQRWGLLKPRIYRSLQKKKAIAPSLTRIPRQVETEL